MIDITKLTPEILESKIVGEQYHQFDNTTVTVCCMTLENGFNVIGESSCIARDNAFKQLWKLYGFNAKQEQHHEKEWTNFAHDKAYPSAE